VEDVQPERWMAPQSGNRIRERDYSITERERRHSDMEEEKKLLWEGTNAPGFQVVSNVHQRMRQKKDEANLDSLPMQKSPVCNKIY
jgi:hypothetical protein